MVVVPMSKIVNTLTLTVKLSGVRVMYTRIWLGTMLIRVAAYVIGVRNVELELKNG